MHYKFRRNQWKFTFIVFLQLCCSVYNNSNAQQCASGNAPETVTVPCGTSCINFQVTIPDIRETSDYLPLSIPYFPYPYTTRTGPNINFTFPPNWPGNSYSDIQDITFPFCFFDTTFDKLVIGANGCVSFDTSMAKKFCEPRIYWGNTAFSLPTNHFAKALIAGIMHDLDPLDTSRVSPNRKIEFMIVGTAPCRRAIISYYQVPLWPWTGNCQTRINTHQIVLHEATGIIDVYVQDKPPCSASNNGLAILGIQNWAQNRAVAFRTTNPGNWGSTGMNLGYRFLPYGGSSRFIQAGLYANGNRLVSTVTTTSSPAAGELQVQFSACPSPTTNFYVVRSQYSSCLGNGETVELYDTVFINHSTDLDATTEPHSATCNQNNGYITVHAPTGIVPLHFSINGGPLQTDSTFTNLAPGTYTLYVEDAAGCHNTLTETVRAKNTITLSFAVDTTSCNGSPDGGITVMPLSGSAPFLYSINNGPFQSSATFTGLIPGNYIINATDANGCASMPDLMITVPPGPGLNVNTQTTSTSCSGANNGTITVLPQNGTAPFNYSLNSGPPQASNTFTNLAPGFYIITVTDANGCSATNIFANVETGQPLSGSVNTTDVTCNSSNNGAALITISNGVGPYQYSLDNISYQPGNSFNGLAAGSYTVYFKDNNSCSGTQTFTINEPSALSATATSSAVKCRGEANGNITLSPAGGTSPYQYSLDGINYQSSPSFIVAAGNYTGYVKDNNGCIASVNTITITEPLSLQANASTQNASCGAGNDGRINITATGGNGTYKYSIDGVNFQTSALFNVSPGNYTIIIKDAKDCQTSLPVTVGLSNTLTIKAINDTTICEGQSVNLNATSIANQYSWSPATGLNNPSVANPVATPSATTTYVVNASLGPCPGKDTVIVNVLPAPIPNAGPDGNICYNASYTLQGSGGVGYQWSPVNNLSSDVIANPIVNPLITTSYFLFVTDVNGCRSVKPDTVIVQVDPPLAINATRDTVVSEGDIIQLHAGGGVSFVWTPATGLDNPLIADPFATVTSDITYRVFVTTNAGCTGEDFVSIKVYKGPDIYVPTGFTPNNDGKNDLFIPFPVGIKTLDYFRIYNRWGQLLFATNVLNKGWDGKLDGIDQPPGAYVWIVKGITKENKVIFKKGTVTLIR